MWIGSNDLWRIGWDTHPPTRNNYLSTISYDHYIDFPNFKHIFQHIQIINTTKDILNTYQYNK